MESRSLYLDSEMKLEVRCLPFKVYLQLEESISIQKTDPLAL